MASSLESMRLEAPALKNTIRNLVNNDLKEICRGEHVAVSGVKAVLQQRVTGLLDAALSIGDIPWFERLKYRIRNHGNSPSPDDFPKTDYASLMTPGRADMSNYNRPAAQPATSRQSGFPTRIVFTKSPFYDVIEPLTRTIELPTLPQNRQTIESHLTLPENVVARLMVDRSLRLMLYCAGDPILGQYSPTDVAFPHQLEVKINGQEVRANFKGLKNKPGSTRPVDVTDLIRIQISNRNPIQIMYALTQKPQVPRKLTDPKRFYIVVNLVKKHSVDELLDRIKRANHISKQSVIFEMIRKANDNQDIVATSTVMSLKDPISTLRIASPCRSTVCSHNQCFDAASFLQLQEQAPTWTCPVCNKTVAFEGLAIDKYVEDILASTKTSVEQVTIEPSGAWSQMTDGSSANTSSGNLATGASDSDSDDLVEISDYRVKNLKGESTNSSLITRTPPLSSREASSAPRSAAGKRTSEVIDLTFSDDDDDPRPARKRPTYAPPLAMDSNRASFRASTGSMQQQQPSGNIAPIRLALPRSERPPSQQPAAALQPPPYLTHRPPSNYNYNSYSGFGSNSPL